MSGDPDTDSNLESRRGYLLFQRPVAVHNESTTGMQNIEGHQGIKVKGDTGHVNTVLLLEIFEKCTKDYWTFSRELELE